MLGFCNINHLNKNIKPVFFLCYFLYNHVEKKKKTKTKKITTGWSELRNEISKL